MNPKLTKALLAVGVVVTLSLTPSWVEVAETWAAKPNHRAALIAWAAMLIGLAYYHHKEG
jgi:hypothetical protein